MKHHAAITEDAQAVLKTIDPEIMLPALHASMNDTSPENLEALDMVGQKLKKAGVDCGPDGCLRGFVRRQIMTYAGQDMIRQIHQALSNSKTD